MPLDDLIGHRELFANLRRELGRRRSQGYLFSGPKGIGKELVAEGLVLSLLCERRDGGDFCCTPDRCPNRGEAAGARRAKQAPPQCECCSACVQVAMRLHPDFDYIALLPKRSFVLIEQVRELIAHLGSKPARGAVRTAIIDDAETLNLSAQNALLKTLEEPPGYAVIFVIAENANALLDTVRSRLRPVHFPTLSTADLGEFLVRKAGLDPARAGTLAMLSRGSAARALALAEGDEPPARELLEALGRIKDIDFVEAHRLAERFFGTREQALENFELMARLLGDALCLKLGGAQAETVPVESVGAMRGLVEALSVESILIMLDLALRAATAVDAMANSRLQAEGLWMAAGETAKLG
jgi:DNA polymerase-3 subunit delta'